MSLSPFILFASACNVVASVSTVALPPRFGIVFYDHWVTPEPIGDDLRCTGGLTPKNAFIAEVPVLNPAQRDIWKIRGQDRGENCGPMRCRDGSEFCGRTSSAVSDKPDNHLDLPLFAPKSGRRVA
jgi:hypothetical protein